VVEEEHSLPPPKDMEAVSSPTFFGWSSSNDNSERYLEDNEDAATEMLKILRVSNGGRRQSERPRRRSTRFSRSGRG
jgi:hypothetical protein